MKPRLRIFSLTLLVSAFWIPWVLESQGKRNSRMERTTHWSYLAPKRPAAPVVRSVAWIRNPIDRFVLGRLEAEGIAPAAEADRATLLRRASLDLTGLPPTPEEADELLRNPSTDAYERAVDRLLDSPDFGEHQARPWLDLARYADSNGYESDLRRSMWRYRDWVIQAFQNNMPFDQFTIKQLAGDLLPSADLDDRIATGFHRNTAINQDGGADDEECRVAAVADRVNTTMSAWMGTTLQCAQCHRHPTDPFTQRDYFGLFAIFNNTRDSGTKLDPVLQMPSQAQRVERSKVEARIAQARHKIDASALELQSEQSAWEKQHRDSAVWRVLRSSSRVTEHGTELTEQPDGSILAGRASLDQDVYIVDADMELESATGFRLEVLPDPAAPKNGPGFAQGNFILSEFQVQAEDGDGQPMRLLEFRDAQATFEQSATYSARAALDGNFQIGWGVAPAYGERQSIVFTLKEPTRAKRLRFILSQNFGNSHLIARFRLAATTSAGPLAANAVPDPIVQILRVPGPQRTGEQRGELGRHFRAIAPQLAPQREQLATLERQLAGLAIDSTLVLEELDEPRPTCVHRRGDFRSPGEAVPPALPAVWQASRKAFFPDRLGLARWLVHRDNPLTARVAMNRLWARAFGRGIVETVDDFGLNGTPPSHPELLDWLAVEFMESGWDLKHMHRLVVTSATYRQASSSSTRDRDPRNRLFARQARLRLDAEALRDQTLAASGLLQTGVGGPSVFPHQPDGVWNGPYLAERWEESPGRDRHRRSLYTFWKRTSPHPLFALFDAPSRETSAGCRPRSNTPLQALAALNERTQIEAAVALARRILAEARTDDRARVDFAFHCCVARSPAERETALLLQLIDANRVEYRADPQRARRLIGAEDGLGADPALLAAWSVACNVLLNLDEFLTRP